MSFDLLHQVEGPREATGSKPAAGPAYVSVQAKNGPPKPDGFETLYELFQRSVKLFGPQHCLGYRAKDEKGVAGSYKWWTYSEVAQMVSEASSAMTALGRKSGDRIGVFGANSPWWMMAMQVGREMLQACNAMSLHCVPLYDSLGEDAVEYIIKHSESKMVLVSAEKCKKLAGALAHESIKGQVDAVVCWGQGPDVDASKQGVMLTHGQVVAMTANLKAFVDTAGLSYAPGDYMLSYLPLAHIFDRTAEEFWLSQGAAIGYWQGDIKCLVDDIGALKPTLFIGVPRVFDRIYNGIKNKTAESGCLKTFIFNLGYARKLHALKQGKPQDKAAPLFDKLVFSKIKVRLGGRVKLIVSGGAPLAPHVEEFLKVTMCAPVLQGYGLTETCSAGGIALPDKWEQTATCGPPVPAITFRLEAVPEMSYDPMADPPRGELLLKGPPIYKGYYKDPDLTAEVLEEDGWFHTGDVAEIVGRGNLKIIDRKKNIFKLSQGEYVAVEKVEAVYMQSKLVEQIFVYGNSFKSCLVAVVVPCEAPLLALAKEQGLPGSYAEVCELKPIRDLVVKDLVAQAQNAKLKGFEIVKAVFLTPEPFSVENDLLTPTFKLKRAPAQKYFQKQIDEMYSTLD